MNFVFPQKMRQKSTLLHNFYSFLHIGKVSTSFPYENNSTVSVSNFWIQKMPVPSKSIKASKLKARIQEESDESEEEVFDPRTVKMRLESLKGQESITSRSKPTVNDRVSRQFSQAKIRRESSLKTPGASRRKSRRKSRKSNNLFNRF